MRCILLDFEIPEAKNFPAALLKSSSLCDVSHLVALDLLVPVAAPPPRLPLARVPVPEGPVNKDREPPAGKRDVHSAPGRAPMAAPASSTGTPEFASEKKLGARVCTPDARHDAASAFRRGRRRAKRV